MKGRRRVRPLRRGWRQCRTCDRRCAGPHAAHRMHRPGAPACSAAALSPAPGPQKVRAARGPFAEEGEGDQCHAAAALSNATPVPGVGRRLHACSKRAYPRAAPRANRSRRALTRRRRWRTAATESPPHQRQRCSAHAWARACGALLAGVPPRRPPHPPTLPHAHHPLLSAATALLPRPAPSVRPARRTAAPRAPPRGRAAAATHAPRPPPVARLARRCRRPLLHLPDTAHARADTARRRRAISQARARPPPRPRIGQPGGPPTERGAAHACCACTPSQLRHTRPQRGQHAVRERSSFARRHRPSVAFKRGR
jgi:hypothetical protein